MKLILSAILFFCILTSSITNANDDIDKSLMLLMQKDLRSKGPATLERAMNQDNLQKSCSVPSGKLSASAKKSIEKAQFDTIKYPENAKYLGDWVEGEKIAQNGRGLQSSDKVGAENGGNCYACHQITKEEIAYGTIGPSLYQYGKLRGNSEAVIRYTWAKIYNAQAFNACSNMPRFGHQQILTEDQLRHVMALLLDTTSPVNK